MSQMRADSHSPVVEAPAGLVAEESLWGPDRPASSAFLPLVRVSLRQAGRLLPLAGLGMLAAAVLLGVVPLYGLLVANVQLQAAINGATLGVPPYVLTADPRALGVLALGLAAALMVTAGTGRRLGLGRAPRLGED
ncbi:MAG TPA: hypothetical protein VIC85_04150 [Ktedonobacterales bacterium]